GFKQNRLRRAQDPNRDDESTRRSKQKQIHSVGKNERSNLRRLRAERETDPDFGHALKRSISEKAVETDRGKQEREAGKNREEKTQETMRSPGFLDAIKHRTRIVDRL